MADTEVATRGATNGYDSVDDDQEYDSDRPTERWAPLGAVSNPEPSSSHTEHW